MGSHLHQAQFIMHQEDVQGGQCGLEACYKSPNLIPPCSTGNFLTRSLFLHKLLEGMKKCSPIYLHAQHFNAIQVGLLVLCCFLFSQWNWLASTALVLNALFQCSGTVNMTQLICPQLGLSCKILNFFQQGQSCITS